jgi:hypothetical protein
MDPIKPRGADLRTTGPVQGGDSLAGKSFYILSAAVLTIAASLCLYFYFRGLWAVSWDESGRTLDAYSWFSQGIARNRVWLPFYRVCVGSAFKVYPDLFLTPRIVTCVFGVIAAGAGGWLTHELFLNRKTTLLVLVLNAFLSQRIALSIAPLSEIMFVAVILLTMSLFANWLRTGSRACLWICAITAAMGSTIRYEGWIFNVAIFLVGLVRIRSREKPAQREFTLWGLALFAYPALRLMAQFAIVNEFAHVLQDQHRYTLREIVRKNPIFEFIVANAVTLNLIGLAGVYQVIRRGEWRQKAVLVASFSPLMCISLYLLIVGAAQTSAPWRMSCAWTMLLMPFTGRFLVDDSWRFWAGRQARTLQLCAIALLLAAFTADTFRIQREAAGWAFPLSDRLAGKYLDELIRAAPGTCILIESSQFFYLTIEVASQHPNSFIENSLAEQPGPYVLSPGDSIPNVVAARNIGLFIFQTEEYKRFLDSSPAVVKLKEFGPWAIYRAVR